MRIKQLSIKLMEHIYQSPELKIKHLFKVMKRVEVRVLIGVEVGDGGVCCRDSDDGNNYWGHSGGKTWGVKKNKRTQMMWWWIKQMDCWFKAWRLWVYRRGGELLLGYIHTEHQNLKNIRGMVGTQELQECWRSASLPQADGKCDYCMTKLTDVNRKGKFLGGGNRSEFLQRD